MERRFRGEQTDITNGKEEDLDYLSEALLDLYDSEERGFSAVEGRIRMLEDKISNLRRKRRMRETEDMTDHARKRMSSTNSQS